MDNVEHLKALKHSAYQRWRHKDPDRYAAYCTQQRAKREARRAERPEEHTQFLRYMKGRALHHKYRLTLEQYDAMVAERGPNCPLCLREAPPAVDHEHATGFIRGLPCKPCNTAMGHAQDDPAALRRMADYLVEATKVRMFS